MAKYHVNPEFGEVGKCTAEPGNCPFGDENQHFNSKQEARDAYEAQMEDLVKFQESPLGKLDSATDDAITRLKKGVAKAVEWLDDHPKIVIAGVAVIAATVAALIAHKVASDYYASTTSVPFDGTLTDGHTRSRIVGIIGKGGYFKTDTIYSVQTPDGAVGQYISDSSKLLPDGTSVPLNFYSDSSIHDLSSIEEALPGVVTATAVSGVLGGGVGIVSGIIASSGIANLSAYLNAKWNLRHEDRFGLTNWRS